MNEIITNGNEIKQRILFEIRNAKRSIYVAMAWFTDRDIANEIIDSRNRFIEIDIILSSNAQNEIVKQMFKESGINVHAFETGDSRGIMHHKFCLIDNRISINGSYNYSYNASNNNVENIHITDDLSVYTQLFAEFERLKYNIDNEIAVNTTMERTETKNEKMKPSNIIDSFSEHLQDLVYSSVQLNTEEYKKKGFETSKESSGNIDIFKVEHENIKEIIRGFATDEGLNNKKNILTSNVNSAYESMKNNIEFDKTEELQNMRRNKEFEIKQTNEKLSKIKGDISILETGNNKTNEKGILQLNKEIELKKLDAKSIEETFIIYKFWNLGNVIISIFLAIFICYLSVFFSSALYKILFEGNIIRNQYESGLNPGIPKLVDANAIFKVFEQEGSIFGFIAIIFFMFPVLLSNIKLIGSKNKMINNLLFWVGLLIFDIIVAAMIAINTNEIKNLLKGTNSNIKLFEVIKQGEFWMIFMFGMIPLIITHYLIEAVTNAYKNSKKETVDAEKNRKLNVINNELIELLSTKDYLSLKIDEKQKEAKEIENEISKIENTINQETNQIELKHSNVLKQIKNIYDDFNGKIISGKIYTDVIFNTVISAYKSGFVEFLPTYYSPNEVANRVKEIDKIISDN